MNVTKDQARALQQKDFEQRIEAVLAADWEAHNAFEAAARAQDKAEGDWKALAIEAGACGFDFIALENDAWRRYCEANGIDA